MGRGYGTLATSQLVSQGSARTPLLQLNVDLETKRAEEGGPGKDWGGVGENVKALLDGKESRAPGR